MKRGGAAPGLDNGGECQSLSSEDLCRQTPLTNSDVCKRLPQMWLSSNVGFLIFCGALTKMKDGGGGQAMLLKQPFHSPGKKMNHHACDCSWQGDWLILHIPVFTKSLVILIMAKDDIEI